MSAADPFDVEVIHAGSAGAVIKAYRIVPPATVADVLGLAAADADFRDIDVAGAAVGIFGRVVPRSRPLLCGDRIELYRPPMVDPKEARRQRVKRARAS
jgi:hypothetical protein